MPFNYGLEDIALTSPCFGESQFGPTGLDNDGDGKIDYIYHYDVCFDKGGENSS